MIYENENHLIFKIISNRTLPFWCGRYSYDTWLHVRSILSIVSIELNIKRKLKWTRLKVWTCLTWYFCIDWEHNHDSTLVVVFMFVFFSSNIDIKFKIPKLNVYVEFKTLSTLKSKNSHMICTIFMIFLDHKNKLIYHSHVYSFICVDCKSSLIESNITMIKRVL